MTTQKESKYGQQYSYTTVKQINGVPTVISSGVASYEPSIGGEENPWKQPIEYIEKKISFGSHINGLYRNTTGRGIFPAPVVGYSEVKVRTIHVDTVRSASGYDITKFLLPMISQPSPILHLD